MALAHYKNYWGEIDFKLIITEKLELDINRFEIKEYNTEKLYSIQDKKTNIIYYSLVIKNDFYYWINFDEMKIILKNAIRKSRILDLLSI